MVDDFNKCSMCGSHRCYTCGEMTCFGCSCDDVEDIDEEKMIILNKMEGKCNFNAI